MSAILVSLLIGVLSGTIIGLMGGGGAMLIVPSLVYILKFNQHLAQGTSLVALLLPVQLLAVIKYYKEGNADIKMGLVIGLGLFIGAFLGALLASTLSEFWMRKIFAIFLITVGISMLVK
ncbi:MAG: sulfite exporter TauE/SafE family protein [Deltaproteobacteria bacterium]|nr:sulfite exporter TauE/SafE family protein [Deltaproteobacteria bacterium]